MNSSVAHSGWCRRAWLARAALVLALAALFPGALGAAPVAASNPNPAPAPRRTILLVIDGLANGAIERLPLRHLEALKREGTYYQELYLPLPAHPRQSVASESDPRYYPWSCSIPNPVMMTGTIFIGQPGIKETLLQHVFRQAGQRTAFLVDSDAYTEIAGGYDTFQAEWNSDDDTPVFDALRQVITDKNPAFIRVHLQSTGAGGYLDQRAKRPIWDANSEYRRRAQKADRLIAEFVRWLKMNDHWSETVLVVCGDHGQADVGGHAPYEPNGDRTSLLLVGKGIRPGAVHPYAEMVDVAPTIAHLHGLPAPKYSQGTPLTGALVGGADEARPRRIQQELNEVMRALHEQAARPGAKPAADALAIEQIGSWHRRFRDPAALLEHQRAASATVPAASRAN